MDTPTTESTVRDVVAGDHRAATVFEKHGIDYCCGGARPLAAVVLDVDPEGFRYPLLRMEPLPTATGETMLARDAGRGQWPVSWSPDGGNLLVVTNTEDTGNDIWVLPLRGDDKPSPFVASTAQEGVIRVWSAR